MKAVAIFQDGDTRGASIQDLPDPTPSQGELVVDVHAVDVNYPDLLHINGTYQEMPPLPFSPGMGGAGIVSAIGSSVRDYKVGQRVLTLPPFGCYAEKVAVRTCHCLPVPEDVEFDKAVALGLSYQTAWFALLDRGKFRAGHNVLVLGASGGVGMASIQLAKAMGAEKVMAATRGEVGARHARKSGADVTIDSGSERLRGELREIVLHETGGRGVDIVIDPVGGLVSAAAIRSLAWDGVQVCVGFAAGEIPKFAANYLLVKNISVSGLQWTDYRDRKPFVVARAQERIFALYRAGGITPEVRVLPLEDFQEALQSISQGMARGKIVLETDTSKLGVA